MQIGDNLPGGTFIFMNGQPYLVASHHLCYWTLAGYDAVLPLANNEPATLLTLRSVLKTFSDFTIFYKIEVYLYESVNGFGLFLDFWVSQ